MSACSYCKKPITCNCQRTRAVDGLYVHKSCVAKYNADIKNITLKTDSLTEKINKANQNITGRR